MSQAEAQGAYRRVPALRPNCPHCLVLMDHGETHCEACALEPIAAASRTNSEVLADLMDFSRSGPLMQAFILEAIGRYARQCAEADPSAFNSPALDGRAWHRCAVEAKEELEKHLGP